MTMTQPFNPRIERDQPVRPAVPRATPTTRFCHVLSVPDPNGFRVDVRVLTRSPGSPWDGTYAYGDEVQAVVWPGTRGEHYRIFEFRAEAWSEDGHTLTLEFIDGAWHARHPMIWPVSSALLTELEQNFGATSGYPNPIPGGAP